MFSCHFAVYPLLFIGIYTTRSGLQKVRSAVYPLLFIGIYTLNLVKDYISVNYREFQE